MKNREFQTAAILIIAIIGIHVFGYVFPSNLTWGFHALGFLPTPFLFAYLFVTAGIVWLARRGSFDSIVTPVATFMETAPYQFLVTVVGIFILAAVFFRVNVPLLGDSFFLIRNFADALRNTAQCYFGMNHWGRITFFPMVQLFQPTTYSGFLNAFLTADILLGIGFIITVFFIVKLLFKEKEDRLLIFCLFLGIPYVQLFLGYVEVYAAVLFVLSVYVLVTLFYVNGKLSFVYIPITFLLMVTVHYLTLLLLPSLFIVGYNEWKKRGAKTVLIGFGITAVFAIGFLTAINFEVSKFSAPVPHSHILPLVPSTDPEEIGSTPYTLLSLFHAADLMNTGLLLYAPAAILVILAVRNINRETLKLLEIRLLLGAVTPVLIFLFMAKFDLGAAKDWDVLAPYAFLAIVLAAILFVRESSTDRRNVLLMIAAISAVNTLLYIHLNSTKDHAIRRYMTLLDRTTMSNVSCYAATLHLVSYYHQVQDTISPVKLWEQYIAAFPQDARGYQNIITNIEHYGPSEYNRIIQTYDRWLNVNPQDTSAMEVYAKFCLEAGNERYGSGMLTEATTFYERAVSLNPFLERAYNNLGSVYAQMGNNAKAIELFQFAIELDSSYSDPYYNLGSAYEDVGEKRKGLQYKKQAARLGNIAAQTQLKDQGIKW